MKLEEALFDAKTLTRKYPPDQPMLQKNPSYKKTSPANKQPPGLINFTPPQSLAIPSFKCRFHETACCDIVTIAYKFDLIKFERDVRILVERILRKRTNTPLQKLLYILTHGEEGAEQGGDDVSSHDEEG